MKQIMLGKHTIPLWALIATSASIGGLVVGLYAALTFTIPFEVKEPLEILDYPSQVSLYPGDIFYFNVTVRNHASQTYYVFLNFSLDNATYEYNYVTFSNTTYSVQSGINNLTAWLMVSDDAPPITTTLSVNVYRQATTARVQEESLQIFKLHTWHNGATFAETAFLIINTGGRDIVIDKISVRGQECSWSTVYYNKTQNTINVDLPYIPEPLTNVTLGGTDYPLTQASDDLILKSGWSMIVYITNPDHVSVSDIGVTVGITVFTANAQYYKEANVESADGGQTATEGITFTGYAWASPSGTTIPSITIKVKNTGASDLSISEVRVDTEVASTNFTLPFSLPKGYEVSITIAKTFTRGTQYGFTVWTSRGNEFGPFTLTAP